jgi:hypothetical protein
MGAGPGASGLGRAGYSVEGEVSRAVRSRVRVKPFSRRVEGKDTDLKERRSGVPEFPV